VWDIDALCLIAARLIVTRLLEDGAPIVVAIDDTLFKRWGRKVHHAFWTHDGSAQAARRSPREPVDHRWDRGPPAVRHRSALPAGAVPALGRQGHHTPVELAGELLNLLAAEFPDRAVHGVGDAAYHGKPLLVKERRGPPGCPPTPPSTIWRRRPPQTRPARAQGRQPRQAR